MPGPQAGARAHGRPGRGEGLWSVGNLALQRALSTGAVQASLSVSRPHDRFEAEADRIADHVMRLPEPALQRKCSACSLGAPCSTCEETPVLVQREVDRTSAGVPSVPDDFLRQFGSGQPLPASTRNFFEPRFGVDFSGVRVHTGEKASGAARSIQAKAFTAGQNIVFGHGRFAPESSEGRQLLAHELTHTIQQRNRVVTSSASDHVSASHDSVSEIQRDSDRSIWGDIAGGVTGLGGNVVSGLSNVGDAVVGGLKDAGGAILEHTEEAGVALARGVTTAATTAMNIVTPALAPLLEKIEAFRDLLREFSPMEGLYRLRDEFTSMKTRLLDLDKNLKEQNAAPVQVAGAMPPIGGLPLLPRGGGGKGSSGGGGGVGFGQPAGGCGLCYGEEPGKVGPREAGSAVHRVVQNIMAPAGVRAELPLGNGRIDLAVIDPVQKQIHIGEIKPANTGGIDAGIEQLEARLRALRTVKQYAGFKAVPLKAPVKQPLRFETEAPFCLEQPGFCFSQNLLVAGPTGGLYLYFCDPSYSQLLSTGCTCKCKEPKPHPILWPIPVPKTDEEKKWRPIEVNWAKVATIAMILALLVGVIAAAICAFATTATVVGIPVAAICAVAGVAAATSMIALIVKARKEPDTTA